MENNDINKTKHLTTLLILKNAKYSINVCNTKAQHIVIKLYQILHKY